ncbi:MAG: SRPBCC family protein [Deltaproteobacteria bacterium]|nr:SRPBCC family protein [Deltaproteobacteria bacterium]
MTDAHAAEKSTVAKVPIEVFFATITDYLAYPEILDDIQTASVVSREGHVTTVAFTLKVLFRTFDYTLRMVEEPPTGGMAKLTWSLVSSGTLAQNDGGWRLEALSPTETKVTYWNELAARSWLPKTFINGLARIVLPKMLKRWAHYAETHHAAAQARQGS